MQAALKDPTHLDAPPQEAGDPPRGLALLALGVLVIAGVRLQVFGVDVGLVLGALLVAVACVRMRVGGVGWLALGWALLELVADRLPATPALDVLGDAVGLTGFLLLCRRRGAEARAAGAERAWGAWRLALRAGALCWGLGWLALTALTVAQWVGGEAGVSHSLALTFAVSSVVALPAVALARASAIEAVERSARPRASARLLARPGAAVALLLLSLTPVWLLLPLWVHHTFTPDFDAYLAQAEGAARLPALPAHLTPLEPQPTTGPAPRGADAQRTTLRWGYTLRVFHGDTRLATVSQDLVRVERWPERELISAEVAPAAVVCDPRLELAVRWAVDARFLEATPREGALTVPLQVDVALSTSRAPRAPTVEGVWTAEAGPRPGGWPTPLGLEPAVDLGSLLLPPGPPPLAEGLVYRASVGGTLTLERSSGGRAYLVADLSASSGEYSYSLELEERFEETGRGELRRTETTRTQAHRLWNGVVW